MNFTIFSSHEICHYSFIDQYSLTEIKSLEVVKRSCFFICMNYQHHKVPLPTVTCHCHSYHQNLLTLIHWTESWMNGFLLSLWQVVFSQSFVRLSLYQTKASSVVTSFVFIYFFGGEKSTKAQTSISIRKSYCEVLTSLNKIFQSVKMTEICMTISKIVKWSSKRIGGA